MSYAIEDLIYVQHVYMFKLGKSVNDIYLSIKSLNEKEEFKQKLRDRLRMTIFKDEVY